MFISVGPSGFTVSGLVALGQAAKTAFPADFLDDGDLMARIVELGTLIIGFWLWGLAAWFFLVSVAANLEAVLNRTLHFSLGWWSFVFPNCPFLPTAVHMSTNGNMQRRLCSLRFRVGRRTPEIHTAC